MTDYDDDDMSLEESLDHDELGPFNVEQLHDMESQAALRGTPEWAFVQEALAPLAQGIYERGNLDIHPRAGSFVKAVLEEVIRVTPDSMENDSNLTCTPVQAYTLLGSLYYNGILGEQNYTKAREYYEKAAERGGVQATLNLGYCYQYGRDVPVDNKKAFTYYSRAYLASPHLTEARYKVADMFFYGLGVERNENVAVHIYQDLIAHGEEGDPWFEDNRESLYRRLALAYRDGRGVPCDLIKALEYYEKLELIHYHDLAAGRPVTPYYNVAEHLDSVQGEIAAIRARLDVEYFE